MPMTTAQGGTAIETTVETALAEFGKLRANQTQLSQDEAFEVNVALTAKLKADLLTALDAAWSD